MGMRWVKGWLVAAVWAMLLLAGCGSAREEGGALGRAEPEPADVSAEVTLTLYCPPGIGNLDAYIREFNRVYKNVTVEKTVFDTPDAFDEAVTGELNAGKGPDMVLFSPITGLDTARMAKNGAFYPLEGCMEVSKKPIREENYIGGLLDAGKVGGKQYFLPISILIPYVAYGGHQSYPFAPGPVLRFADFKDAVYEDLERYQNDSETGISGMLVAELPLMAAQIWKWDETGEHIEYDPEQLRELMEFVKDTMGEYRRKSEGILEKKGHTPQSRVENFRYLCGISQDFVMDAKALNALQYTLHGSRMRFSVLTDYGGSTVGAIAGVYGAVNRNAGDKAVYAYEFFRTAMDSKPQSGKIMGNYLTVNKWKIKEQIVTWKGAGPSYYIGSLRAENPGFGEELAKELMELIDSIDQVTVMNREAYGILIETFEPYWNGNASYESCFQDFDQRIRLYATE